jgi:hypothetical protein
VLHPGKRPTGRENAAIVGRVLRLMRQAWPHTHIILHGDGHFANPELMALCEQDEQLDFIFGLASNQVLLPQAEPLLNKARALRQNRLDNARRRARRSRASFGCMTTSTTRRAPGPKPTGSYSRPR